MEVATQAPDSPGRLAEVEDIFATSLSASVSDADFDLIENGILDSLLLVELIMELESRFGVTVDIEDLEFENFRSIRSICDFVERNAGAGVPA